MKNYLILIGVFAAFALLLAGSRELFQITYLNDLEQTASAALQSGDYIASLEGYLALKNEKGGEEGEETEAKITEAKNLLIAEEMLARAEKAKADGDWFAVKALLEEGAATENPEFKDYEAAVALSLEAANKVRDLEEKIEKELARFRQEAVAEKARRESAEEKAETANEKAAKANENLAATIKEKEQTSLELQVVTSAKLEAEREAVRERFLKFLNELELYVNMLARADGHLNDAIFEIEGKRDISALIFLDRGTVLLDEVKVRAEELLANRTEEQYKDEVQKLLQSSGLFIASSRSFRDASFYINRDNDKMSQFLSDGKTAKHDALETLDAVRAFISASR